MSDEAQEKARRELSRLSKMPPISPEAAVIRSYLDWLLDLPWGMRTEENTNIARAEQLLDRDHYGLEKVKDRILEFLAAFLMAGPLVMRKFVPISLAITVAMVVLPSPGGP